MIMAPSATAVNRASIGITMCSEAYLSRKLTPKNSTMTPKRTTVLPPKKKFQSGAHGPGPVGEDASGGTALGQTSSGAGVRCDGKGSAIGVSLAGSGTVDSAGKSLAPGMGSARSVALGTSTCGVPIDSLSRIILSSDVTRCCKSVTDDSSILTLSSPAVFGFCDNAQPTPAPAKAPRTAP